MQITTSFITFLSHFNQTASTIHSFEIIHLISYSDNVLMCIVYNEIKNVIMYLPAFHNKLYKTSVRFWFLYFIASRYECTV